MPPIHTLPPTSIRQKKYLQGTYRARNASNEHRQGRAFTDTEAPHRSRLFRARQTAVHYLTVTSYLLYLYFWQLLWLDIRTLMKC